MPMPAFALQATAGWQFWQPFQGGTAFVATQAAGWALTAASLASMLWIGRQASSFADCFYQVGGSPQQILGLLSVTLSMTTICALPALQIALGVAHAIWHWLVATSAVMLLAQVVRLS